jgi:hypothetical protein
LDIFLKHADMQLGKSNIIRQTPNTHTHKHANINTCTNTYTEEKYEEK